MQGRKQHPRYIRRQHRQQLAYHVTTRDLM